MELFRLDASGVGHLDALGNESVRFAGVLLNGLEGILWVAQSQIVWRQSASDALCSDSDPFEADAYCVPLDSFEAEVLLTAVEVDEFRLFGVKMFLSSSETEVNFLFQERDGATSKQVSQQCFRLLEKSFEAQKTELDIQAREGENDPSAVNSIPNSSPACGPKERRRKRKDRRKSLSLDALHPFLLEEDKDESKQAPSPVPEASLSPEREAPNEIDEMDVVSLARRFVSSTNPDESEAFASMIYSKHGYEVSQIRTPTSKSLQDSPPRHRQPKKKEIIKLKPIVVQMSTSTKEEKARIQSQTKVRIVSPRTRKGSIQYFDAVTNKRVSVEEYAARYYKSILGRGDSDPDPRTTDGDSERDQTMSAEEQLERCRAGFVEALSQAELKMNDIFDTALDEFRQTKARLTGLFVEEMRALSVDDTGIAEVISKEDEKFFDGIGQQGFTLARSNCDTKKSRRKSVCLEHMSALLQEEHPNQGQDEASRVIWKAN